MDRLRRRADRVKTEIPITRLLADYDYHVRPDGGDREEQFPCDLHGDGRDTKPSARVYPESNSWYCFACDRARDTIDTVRVKENVSFIEAIALLEKKYGLPTFPWEAGGTEGHTPTLAERVAVTLRMDKTYADDRARMVALLESATRERELPMDTVLSYWEAVDQLDYRAATGALADPVARAMMVRLHERFTVILHRGG